MEVDELSIAVGEEDELRAERDRLRHLPGRAGHDDPGAAQGQGVADSAAAVSWSIPDPAGSRAATA